MREGRFAIGSLVPVHLRIRSARIISQGAGGPVKVASSAARAWAEIPRHVPDALGYRLPVGKHE